MAKWLSMQFQCLALAAAMVTSWGASAWACQPLILCAPVVPFAAGSQVPASAVAIPVQLPKQMGTGKLAQAQLLDASGQPVPIEVVDDAQWGWQLVKPTKGLKAGASYTLRLESTCQAPSGVTPTLVDTPFTAGPAAPVPATFGTLTLTPKPPAVFPVWTLAGSCVVPLKVAQAEVALDADPSLTPWLALTRTELWIDGKLWLGSGYGDLPLVAASATQTDSGGRNIHSFYVPCADVPQYADAGVLPGQHHVDLRLYIAGQNLEAPYLWGDVNVTCGPGNRTDAGSTADTSGSPPPSPQSKPSGGCSAGPATGGGMWLLVAMAAALVRHRRRMLGR